MPASSKVARPWKDRLVPDLSQSELQDLIDEAGFGAVSLDTNVFHKLNYNLESKLLREMSQFPNHGIRHLVTDVVAGEVRAHMIDSQDQAKIELRAALRRFVIARGLQKAERDRIGSEIGLDEDVEEAVFERWLEFVGATELEILGGTPADGDALVRMYFSRTPPFEARADKKHEFPDAIALLTLEAAGEAMGKYVLAVSNDGGWKLFASKSKWVVVIDDLKAAVSLLHTADAIAGERALALLADEDAGMRDDLDAAIGDFLDEYYPEIEAESYMDFDADFEEASLVDVEPVDPSSALTLASDTETVTLAFDIHLIVDMRARFTFQVENAVDGDAVSFGAREVTKRQAMVLPVTLVALRTQDGSTGAVSVSIEQGRPQTVNFGFVEPKL